jgi:hypothetical protein
MRDVYFSVKETTEEEKEQLKEKIFWDDVDEYEDILDEADYKAIDVEYPEDIPDYIVEKVFADITFVDEDFWCNCK